VTQSSILIVGATGQLGTRILKRLASEGERPRALVRSLAKAQAIQSVAFPVLGDLRDPDSLRDAFEGAERVFIVAPPVQDMELIERNAIDAALKAGAKRIVYLSNFAAKEGSVMMPMHVHGLHERVIASLGLEFTVLGPTRYMTNFPFNWPSVIDDGMLLEAGGDGLMTCIDPDDVAEIAAMALTEDGHSGAVYRLTGDDAFSASGLAELLSKVLQREIRTVRSNEQNPLGGYFGLVAAGVYERTETAANLLGRRPRSYADWLQQNLPALASPVW